MGIIYLHQCFFLTALTSVKPVSSYTCYSCIPSSILPLFILFLPWKRSASCPSARVPTRKDLRYGREVYGGRQICDQKCQHHLHAFAAYVKFHIVILYMIYISYDLFFTVLVALCRVACIFLDIIHSFNCKYLYFNCWMLSVLKLPSTELVSAIKGMCIVYCLGTSLLPCCVEPCHCLACLACIDITRCLVLTCLLYYVSIHANRILGMRIHTGIYLVLHRLCTRKNLDTCTKQGIQIIPSS